jgi:hypothetical protein
MNVIKWTEIALLAGSLAIGVAFSSMAGAEGVKEEVQEVGRDTKKVAKKTARKVDDKTCEMVNGKMECAGKKVKHGVQNAGDEVKDKADDLTH